MSNPWKSLDVRASCKSWLEWARCALAVAVATVRVALARFTRTDFRVYKAVAIRKDGRDYNVTATFDPATWETSLPIKVFPLDRVDVRYIAHCRKFRMVLRPGDACVVPPVPERHRGGPKGVMAAELVGDGATVAVTKRVLKYQGPAKDFHAGMGLRVGVTDMFPFDDPEELVAQFHTLRLVDAAVQVVDLPMECTDLGASLARPNKKHD